MTSTPSPAERIAAARTAEDHRPDLTPTQEGVAARAAEWRVQLTNAVGAAVTVSGTSVASALMVGGQWLETTWRYHAGHGVWVGDSGVVAYPDAVQARRLAGPGWLDYGTLLRQEPAPVCPASGSPLGEDAVAERGDPEFCGECEQSVPVAVSTRTGALSLALHDTAGHVLRQDGSPA